MKKKFSILLLSACLLAGCSGNTSNTTEPQITDSTSTTDSEIRNVYEAYKANGGTLSYDEWLKSIKGEKGDKGDKGDTGADGKSAYQIWLDAGHTGSEEDFLNWLKNSNEEDNLQGLNFHLQDDGTYSVSAGKANLLSQIIIPSSYNGKKITSILEAGFKDCENLENITIPNSITSIGESAFEGCKSLKKIAIPDSVTTMGDYVLCSCENLTNVVISNNLTSIGYKAFAWCINLENIAIPDSVTNISDGAFYCCKNLMNIVIPNNIISIGESAFQNCLSLKCNEFDNGYYLGSEDNPYLLLVKAKTNGIKSCVINENCMFMQSYSFQGCTNLLDVIIPKSITTIVTQAFAGCYSLTNISIPESVTKIETMAFSACTGLTSIVISDSVKFIESQAFDGCKYLKYVYYKGSLGLWNDMIVEDNTLLKANKFFYSVDEPTDADNKYWHYVDDKPTLWEEHTLSAKIEGDTIVDETIAVIAFYDENQFSSFTLKDVSETAGLVSINGTSISCLKEGHAKIEVSYKYSKFILEFDIKNHVLKAVVEDDIKPIAGQVVTILAYYDENQCTSFTLEDISDTKGLISINGTKVSCLKEGHIKVAVYYGEYKYILEFDVEKDPCQPLKDIYKEVGAELTSSSTSKATTKSYTTRAVIVAIGDTSSSYVDVIFYDGETYGTLSIGNNYLKDTSSTAIAIGTTYRISGKMCNYWGVFEFKNDTTDKVYISFEKESNSSNFVTAPTTPTAWTGTEFDDFKAIQTANNTTLADAQKETGVPLSYVSITGTYGSETSGSKTYSYLYVDGDTNRKVSLSKTSAAALGTLTEGTSYDVSMYLLGYNTSYGYLNVIIDSISAEN